MGDARDPETVFYVWVAYCGSCGMHPSVATTEDGLPALYDCPVCDHGYAEPVSMVGCLRSDLPKMVEFLVGLNGALVHGTA